MVDCIFGSQHGSKCQTAAVLCKMDYFYEISAGVIGYLMDAGYFPFANRVYAYVLRIIFGRTAYRSVSVKDSALAPAGLAVQLAYYTFGKCYGCALGASSLWMWWVSDIRTSYMG